MITKLLILSHLILIVIASYLGVKFSYQLILTDDTLPEKPQAAVIQKPKVKQAVSKPESFYRNIAASNLFGAPPQEQKVDDAAATGKGVQPVSDDLGLILWGTVAGSKRYMYAVIEDKKQREQNLYTVDDKIKDDVTIKLILREQVILSVNGEDRKLEIEKPQSVGPKRFADAVLPRPMAPTERSSIPAQRISLRREDIDKSMNNLPDLMGQIKIRPNLIEGTPQGLKVSSIKPRSIFRRMGLRNGDVITGVNGQDIQTVDDALKLYESLKEAPNATLQLKRRGRDKTIEYSIK